jgi:hypothetical protein
MKTRKSVSLPIYWIRGEQCRYRYIYNEFLHAFSISEIDFVALFFAKASEIYNTIVLCGGH